jgi:hypothetical protein
MFLGESAMHIRHMHSCIASLATQTFVSVVFAVSAAFALTLVVSTIHSESTEGISTDTLKTMNIEWFAGLWPNLAEAEAACMLRSIYTIKLLCEELPLAAAKTGFFASTGDALSKEFQEPLPIAIDHPSESSVLHNCDDHP